MWNLMNKLNNKENKDRLIDSRVAAKWSGGGEGVEGWSKKDS